MNARHTHTHTDDLRDPGLTALLQEAYADDPALAEAPGRADRIMRAVMASGVQPRFVWAPYAWAAATVAAAATAVLLAFGVQQPPATGPDIATQPTPPSQTQPVLPAAPTREVTKPSPNDATPLPTVTEQPQPTWIAPPRITEPQTPSTPEIATIPTPPSVEPSPATDTADEVPTYVAADLYAVGSTAHAAGDYETAYAAYQASYDMIPTPEALLASAEMLQRLAEEETLTIEG